MERKTPLHWACHLDQTNMCQVLIDFGANMYAKDDYSKKPHDEVVATSQAKGGIINKDIVKFFEKADAKTLRRDTKRYNAPLYVKYLTPVEQVKELAEFLARVRDMSTLTTAKKQADDQDSDDVEHQVVVANIGNKLNTQD